MTATAGRSRERLGHTGLGDLDQHILSVGAAVFTLGLAAWLIATRATPHQSWSMLDLQIYRWAGVVARHGHDAYTPTYHGLSYTYTPFALLLSAAASVLSISVLRVLVTVASLLALLAIVWAAWGMAGLARDQRRVGLTLGVAGLALWLEPIVQNLRFGQINLLLVALVVLDLARADSSRWKGVGVGIAAAIKLVPAIFIVYLLLTGRWRAAGRAVGVVVGGVVLGFVAFPGASAHYWFGRLFIDSSRVGGVAYVSNQSLNGALVRLLGGVSPAVPWWIVLFLAVGAGGLALAVWAHRQGDELLAVVVVALTGLLVSPISWSHHWVWVPVGLVAALEVAVIRPHRALAALGVVAVVLGVFAWVPVKLIWRVPYSEGREYHWHGWQLLVGNTYVEFGLLLLGVVALYLWSRARASRGSAGAGRRGSAEAGREALASV
ncbi:MAG TPA: glycosyltransferase 87 family protein [Actinomycetota bacterium]|nr:glycosyltransferase 87 family protein [Actinomycetota bacterium]